MKEIIFIGDSLVEYFDWQSRFSDYKVTNMGLSGETVEGLLDRINSIQAKNPDFIFIMTGINNIAMEDYGIIKTYTDIVNRLKSRFQRSVIGVQSILPVSLYWIDNKKIQEINNLLKALSEDSGAEYLDIFSLFIDDAGQVKKEYLLDDGVHLSNKGYEIWTEAVEKFLKQR